MNRDRYIRETQLAFEEFLESVRGAYGRSSFTYATLEFAAKRAVSAIASVGECLDIGNSRNLALRDRNLRVLLSEMLIEMDRKTQDRGARVGHYDPNYDPSKMRGVGP